MNWGGFAGGLSQGINNGIKVGTALKQGQKDRALEDVRAKGMAEASAKRDSDINGMVQEASATSSDAAQNRQQAVTEQTAADTPQVVDQAVVPTTADTQIAQADVQTVSVPQPQAQVRNVEAPVQPSAQITPDGVLPQPAQQAAPIAQQQQGMPAVAANGITASGQPQAQQAEGRFMVGNQRFATREEALAAATKKVASVSDYVVNTIAPKMQEHYIANGEVEKAAALGKYMESKKGKDATQLFGNAMSKLMFTDDLQGGVDALGDYYNKFVDDGVDFGGGKRLEDGRISITLKNKANGKDNEMILTPQELLRIGMAHDPAKLFEMTQKQAAAAEAARAELAKENRVAAREDTRDQRNHKQAIELKGVDAALDEAKASTKTRREIAGKVSALKDAGYSDEFINGVMPGIIGVGDYKKGTSPEEAKRLALSDRMKNDPTFSRKPRDEQQKIIDGDMALVYGGVKPSSTPDAKPAPATPAAGGMPGATPAGKPMFDTKTGKIVIR